MSAPLDLRAVDERLRHHLATAGDRELGYPQAECCDLAEEAQALLAYCRVRRTALTEMCDAPWDEMLGDWSDQPFADTWKRAAAVLAAARDGPA